MLCYEESQQIKTKCVDREYMQRVYAGHRSGPLTLDILGGSKKVAQL